MGLKRKLLLLILYKSHFSGGAEGTMQRCRTLFELNGLALFRYFSKCYSDCNVIRHMLQK